MLTPGRSHSSVGFVEVALEGGPADLPQRVQLDCDPLTALGIKVRHRNGYEHFERAAGGHTPPRFHWTMRTRIAE